MVIGRNCHVPYVGCFLVALGLLALGAFVITRIRMEECAHQCQLRLKNVGMSLEIFATDNQGHYPQIPSEPGRLTLLNQGLGYSEALYPAYMQNFWLLCCPMKAECRSAIVHEATDPQAAFNESDYIYLGYAITNDAEMESFALAYREHVKAGLPFDGDLSVAEGTGNMRRNTIYKLRQGVGRFLITDMIAPGHAQRRHSTFPILIERLGHRHRPEGGNVLYMDNRVEFIPYPGKWPMTEKTMKILGALEAMKKTPRTCTD
jgi:hypothetical protein